MAISLTRLPGISNRLSESGGLLTPEREGGRGGRERERERGREREFEGGRDGRERERERERCGAHGDSNRLKREREIELEETLT